jgi:hypothetical protein
MIEREISRVVPPSALAGRPRCDVRLPAENIGEDSAWRLAVKAEPYGRHSAAFRCPPLRSVAALTAAHAAALEESPISAGLAAPSERPGLGAQRNTLMWHT